MIRYRKAIHSDYKEFANIHVQAFEGFFLTTLGINFLRTYYRSCLKDEKTVAVCAFDDDGIIGFASGSILSKGYNKSIIASNLIAFGWVSLTIIFTKPLALIRLFNNLTKSPNENDKGDYSELLSIGISPTHKGKGIGKQILIEFEKQVIAQGGKRVSLTTDCHDNDAVVGFYKKIGYEIFYDFMTYPNRKMLKMLKTLNKY